MKRLYRIVSLIVMAGSFASCNNDLSGVNDIIPSEPEGNTSYEDSRSFAQDDGAEELRGSEAEIFWQVLQGVDDAFPRRLASYQIEDFQYQEIKEFTDELVEGRTTDSQKYRAIWIWITKNIKYNTELNPAYSNEPYDVFVNKKCVCQGYANLMNVMARTQDIDVINVNGFLSTIGGHAWNYVRHGGRWWLSDPTNGIEHKAEEVDGYKEMFIPYSADGNFLETPEYSYNYVDAKVNLNVVKTADDAMEVPFSVTLNNGKRYRITAFSPSEPLPDNVREIYIGSNIVSLMTASFVGLSTNAPNVEAAYVDPNNTTLHSYAGVVYRRDMEEPVYIPAAMKTMKLMPLEVIGKNHVFDHAGIEELVVSNETKRLEAWAVEKCPNLKVAYVPVDTELDEQAFADVHPDFHIVRQNETGIKDIVAD